MIAVLREVDVAGGKYALDDDIDEGGDATGGREAAEGGEEELLREAEFGVPRCEGRGVAGYDELRVGYDSVCFYVEGERLTEDRPSA